MTDNVGENDVIGFGNCTACLWYRRNDFANPEH